MLITEITDIGFNRTFCGNYSLFLISILTFNIMYINFIYIFLDSMPASMIKESDPLYCLELPKLNDCSNESGPYLLLCWVNTLVVEDQCSRLFVLVIIIYLYVFIV